MNQQNIASVAESLGRIEKFERDCEDQAYTDTGEAWQLIEHLRETLRAVISEALEKA